MGMKIGFLMYLCVSERVCVCVSVFFFHFVLSERILYHYMFFFFFVYLQLRIFSIHFNEKVNIFFVLDVVVKKYRLNFFFMLKFNLLNDRRSVFVLEYIICGDNMLRRRIYKRERERERYNSVYIKE